MLAPSIEAPIEGPNRDMPALQPSGSLSSYSTGCVCTLTRLTRPIMRPGARPLPLEAMNMRQWGTHASVTFTGWQTSQRQTADGAVESEQRVVLEAPAVAFDEAGASALGERYWQEVQRATYGLVRARQAGGIELRLLGRGPVLLSFAAPALEAGPESVRCRFPISGGLLTRRAAGEISFTQLDGD